MDVRVDGGVVNYPEGGSRECTIGGGGIIR
jgi:hypothetical protein